MAQISVRRLGAGDLADFRSIRLEALKRHPEAFGASFKEELHYPDAMLAERLRQNAVFGAFNSDGALQGIVGVAFGRAMKTRHIASIWGMYVRSESRGMGLSKLLLDAVIQEAPRECRSIRLSVVSTNQAALRLYRMAGFREWAHDSAALKVDGVFYDEILMRLDRE